MHKLSTAWSLAATAVALLLLTGVVLPACASMDTKNIQPGMSLSSGQDYIGDRGDEGYATGERDAVTYSMDKSVSAAGASAPPTDASGVAKDSRQLKGSLDSAPGPGDPAALLKNWFVPAAYAQDHKLDERYLRRTGSASLQVEKYQDASNRLTAIAASYNGMVSGTESSRDADDSMGGVVTLRIPSTKFAQAWADVLGIGKVLSEKVSTDDVSHEYLGHVSHMKNLLAEQAALQNMLTEALAVQRARGLGEGYKILLDTQERLFAVTGELESTEDSLNALADQITRSTIVVQLMEAKQLPQQVQQEFTWGIGTTAAQAFQDLRIHVRDWLKGLTYFIITCWTWVIPWALIILLARWAYRRYLKPRGYSLPALVTAGSGGGGGSAPVPPVADQQPKQPDDIAGP